jgi:hypothetical protein
MQISGELAARSHNARRPDVAAADRFAVYACEVESLSNTGFVVEETVEADELGVSDLVALARRQVPKRSLITSPDQHQEPRVHWRHELQRESAINKRGERMFV